VSSLKVFVRKPRTLGDTVLDQQLQKLRDEIGNAVSGLSAEQLAWHPQGKWCLAEILEHLYLTYRGTLKASERCLEKGRPLARSPNLKDWLRTTVVVTLGYMPEGRKSPEPATPRGMAAEDTAQSIGPELTAMDAAIAKCEQQFGKSARLMDHPILGPLTARQWRKFHWVHGQHHLKQIRRLRSLATAIPSEKHRAQPGA
jgi:hypothetical protein